MKDKVRFNKEYHEFLWHRIAEIEQKMQRKADGKKLEERLEGRDGGINLRIWNEETQRVDYIPLTETIEKLAEYLGIKIEKERSEVKIIKKSNK